MIHAINNVEYFLMKMVIIMLQEQIIYHYQMLDNNQSFKSWLEKIT